MIAAALVLAACGTPTGPGDDSVPEYERVTATTLYSNYPSPDEWHRLALYGNWDFIDPAAWRAIVVHPDVDRATALAIFWKASPEYYVQFADREAVPAVNRANYDLIELIRGRWQEEAYTRSELSFDPDTDAWPVDFEGLRQRSGARVDRLMPPGMRIRLEGRRLSDEGFRAPGVQR